MLDGELLSNLCIVLTAIACTVAALTAIIYTWACCKTRPLRLPTVGLTMLLWVFFILLVYRCAVAMVQAIWNENLFLDLIVVTIAGYTVFLVGTFRDHVIIDRIREKE